MICLNFRTRHNIHVELSLNDDEGSRRARLGSGAKPRAQIDGSVSSLVGPLIVRSVGRLLHYVLHHLHHLVLAMQAVMDRGTNRAAEHRSCP